MPIVLNFGSLKLLEPSGSVHACNGIALPLPFYSYQTLFLSASSLMSILFSDTRNERTTDRPQLVIQTQI
jgi:hypothetical protein